MSYQPPPSFGQVQTPPPSAGPPVGKIVLVVGLLALVAVAVGAFLLGGFGPSPPLSPVPSPTAAAQASGTPPSPTATSVAPPASQPGITPTAEPSPTSAPTADTGPSPSLDPGQSPGVGRSPPPDIAAQIDEVASQVPLLRELEPLRDVPYVLLSREEFQAELAQMMEEEVDPEALAIETRLLARLNLLPDDADLFDLLLELYGSQVAAYYRPDTGSFYIIERDEPFSAMDRMIVAHEYTHALQDQHFDLEGTRITDPSEGDAALAQLAAVEGDASLIMFQWAFESLELQEQLELFASMGSTTADQELLESMPPILRRQLEFPYSEGFLFASQVQGEGGMSAIDETLVSPPASTEQVLHPEKYFAGETPVRIAADALAGPAGAGWSSVYQQTMGELNIQVWLADGDTPPLPGIPAPPTDWQQAAAGWGGDRLQMFENDDERWAIVWQTAWDSQADAEEFADLATELLPGLDGPAELLSVSRGATPYVTVLVASDQASLDSLREAVGE